MNPEDKKVMQKLIDKASAIIMKNMEDWVRIELKHAYSMGFLTGQNKEIKNLTKNI